MVDGEAHTRQPYGSWTDKSQTLSTAVRDKARHGCRGNVDGTEEAITKLWIMRGRRN